MQLAQLLFACVLQIVTGGPPAAPCQENQLVAEVASAIQASSEEFDVPADIIAAVIYHESKYNPRARGDLGEIGLMQIKRNGAVQGRYAKMSFRKLAEPRLNIYLGTRYLASFIPRCRPPKKYLAWYNRGHGCSPSRYSHGVLTDLQLGLATRVDD